MLGLFSKYSHERKDGVSKQSYSEASARKAALRMEEKHGVHFSPYKCIFCDGWHIGANRDSRDKTQKQAAEVTNDNS